MSQLAHTTRPGTHRDAEEWLKNRSHYRPWAELMKRAFEIDVLQCPSCGGKLLRRKFGELN